VENNPSLHHIRVQLGHAHKESGDLHNAARAYYTVLKHTPLDDDLHLQIGHLEELRGNTQRAVAAYQKSAQLNPGNAHAVAEYLGLAVPVQVEEIVARTLPAQVEEIVARELPARVEQAVDRTLLAKQSQISDQEISRRSFRPNDIVAGSIVGE